DHANVGRTWDFINGRLLGGLLIAWNRCRKWPISRRVLYVGGSFLIPLVLLPRLLPGVQSARRLRRLPAPTIPPLVAGVVLRSCGEMFGYAGLFGDHAVREMHEYEMHKLKYLGSGGI